MTRRRARILRLRCPCERNIADITAGVPQESVRVTHRATLTSPPDAPRYEWVCRCGRTHRAARHRLTVAYMEDAAAGSVMIRYLGRDL